MAEPTTPANPRPEDKPVHQPVMDVLPPKPVEQPKAAAPEEPHPAPADVAADEPVERAPVSPSVSARPKRHRSGVALAIIATIIIVLGLGALFVYAYLRTNHISIF